MSKRDAFITVIKEIEAASLTITKEQRIKILQLAHQQYGLTSQEADCILSTSCLVVGEKVDYFEVLEISIGALQHQTDAAIEALVAAAHQKLYRESLNAGGAPRLDGRTQEQWRELLNQARDTLKNPQKRKRHIRDLQKSKRGIPGERIDYFKVLDLRLEGIQYQTDTDITRQVDDAYQKSRQASFTAGGMPRPDGKTQEQWRKILLQARDTLKDAQKRKGHIAALQTAEDPIDTLLNKLFRVIYKFSNGDEATTILQLADLMEKNRRDATDALYRNFIGQRLRSVEEMHFANAAQDIVAHFPNHRDIGLMAMVAILRGRVRFQTGSEATRPQQLALRIDQNWEQAKTLLYRGFFALWLEYTRHPQLAAAARDIINRHPDEKDIGVEKFVQRLHPQIGTPRLETSQTRIHLWTVQSGASKTVELTAKNTGRGFLHGTVELRNKLPGIRITPTDIRGDTTIALTLDARLLPSNQTNQTTVLIDTNGGRVPIPMFCTIPPEDMVLIPAGDFQMGSNHGDADEKPVRAVYTDVFYIDKYPVTNAQYKIFLSENPQRQKDNIHKDYHNRNYLRTWHRNNYPKGKSDYPVVYVSWYAAMAYAQWVGKRLPTEAEWEKAARGGLVGKKYSWGDVIDTSKANYKKDVRGTTGVGMYPPNAYGLYDMVGNVWEWCLDAYDERFYAVFPHENPIAGDSITGMINNYKNITSYRVLRGGSWGKSARYVRVAYHYRDAPASADTNYGFRCVKAVTA